MKTRRLFPLALALVFLLLLTFTQVYAEAVASDLASSINDTVDYYQTHYGLRNVYDKRVDDHGNGYEPLYGVRNFRVVLNGLVYRGGANNAFNRHGVRNNSNPLPPEGLKNLCEEGFSESVYLYPTRYSTDPSSLNCQSRRGESNTLKYAQLSPLASDAAAKSILKIVNDHLNNPMTHGPLYLHCWNGWHASGYISALILRQFCGMSAEDSVAYWNRNTDGVNKGPSYERIRTKLRKFVPYADMSLPAELKAKVCF